MERIEALVQKLKEQLGQKASPAQLMFTVQLLQQEIAQLEQTGSRTLGTSKVSVVLPQGMNIAPAHEKYAPKITEEPPAVKEVKETVWVENGSVSVVQKNGQLDMVFDPMTEIPTLSHQPKEVNENAGHVESLNDILKEGKTELVEVLKETPVKDLRKAIGINDRFVFINDLFRGDEAMYERSIKTINSFNIFAEAEYWINREMKVKLGWNNDHPTVQHFDQLVKRRFS
jgi:hypothetical protein